MRRVDLRGRRLTDREYRAVLPRASFDVEAAIRVVRPICEAVRDEGYDAIVRYNKELDGVTGDRVQVPASELAAALDALAPPVRSALEESIARLRRSCAAELPRDTVTELAGGGVVTLRNVAVDRVGVYVPAARAPLVSSVVMNVVPAQLAGVSHIALASPGLPAHGGLPHPAILAAAALLGVDAVYAVGGAVAYATFAYGYDAGPDDRCRPVDLATGPSNIYGVAAKRLLRSVVGIDSEAGPTEIAVLADETANPVFVAADLVSQAEHAPDAASLLVTDSLPLADSVDAELARTVPGARHVERIAAALDGPQSASVVVDDMAHGEDVVNAYAAEHLEIQTRDAAAVASRIRNAGAVFVGAHSPVSLGDYCAGSNHVLPTGACACHSSGLSVRTFLKTMQVIDYSAAALAEVAAQVLVLSEAEDLPAHGDAVRVRLRPV